ncbi:DUF935 domain-containing protein [Kaistia sp. MMO-174]|uniref:DUF935 domain-containing protein n=1 Tax=Kaistia sp. MMO-174 TaxID=3081256 RepID=UPI0030166227
MALLDQFGRPMKPAVLREEISGPSLTGIRRHYDEVVASGLTPGKLASILREAVEGDADAYLTLAEEMEERDLHYRSQIALRKGVLLGLEPQVEAATDEARDQEIAEAVRDLIGRPQFSEMIEDLVDGLGKGYSVAEMIWDTTSTPWEPGTYKWRDPRWFLFDKVDRTTLRMKEDGAFNGVDLPPAKFIVHIPKLKSGIPIRGGLARLAAWAFMLKSYTLRDWAEFAEVYGKPYRVGKYGPGASEDDKAVLLRAIRDIAADAGAMIPDSMMIEFIEASNRGEPVFGSLAEYLDKQVSKGVLGQTMSSDDGASRAQAEVHNGVRMDIAKMDGRQLGRTISRQLVIPFVLLNYGPQKIYPEVTFPVPEPEDLKALTDNLAKLVPMGLRVGTSVIRDKLQIPDPQPGEEILVAPASRPAAPVPVEAPGRAAAAALGPVCAGCGQRHALAASAPTDPLDSLIGAALEGWERPQRPLFVKIRSEWMAATSYDDLKVRLDALAGSLPVAEQAQVLAVMTMIARGLGEAGPG